MTKNGAGARPARRPRVPAPHASLAGVDDFDVLEFLFVHAPGFHEVVQGLVHLHFVAQLPERGHQILDADAVTGRDEEDLAAVGTGAGPQLFQTLLVHQVDLVDDLDLAAFGQFGVEAAQLLVDELETGPGIVVAHVLDAEDVHQKAGALHMLEEAVAQALAFVGALDEAGDVGDDHAAVRVVLVDHDAQVGGQGGEGIGRDLGPRRRDLRDEGGLARVGQAQQTGVGQDLQFQAQLAFLAGKVKDEEDTANLVETSKHYGEIAEKKFDDWLIPGRYLVFGDRDDLTELKAAELTPLTAVLKEHDAKIREKQRAASSNDPAYIISGSAFRMLVGDLFDLLAQYGNLRNRVLDVKTERQLARLQKNLSGDHPAIRRMYCRWGFAEDQGVTCYDILEAKLRRAHLTPYDPDGSEDNHD